MAANAAVDFAEAVLSSVNMQLVGVVSSPHSSVVCSSGQLFIG